MVSTEKAIIRETVIDQKRFPYRMSELPSTVKCTVNRIYIIITETHIFIACHTCQGGNDSPSPPPLDGDNQVIRESFTLLPSSFFYYNVSVLRHTKSSPMVGETRMKLNHVFYKSLNYA